MRGLFAPGPRAPSLLRGCFSFCQNVLRIVLPAVASLGTESKEAAPQGLYSIFRLLQLAQLTGYLLMKIDDAAVFEIEEHFVVESGIGIGGDNDLAAGLAGCFHIGFQNTHGKYREA
jgi:hypothetical protein